MLAVQVGRAPADLGLLTVNALTAARDRVAEIGGHPRAQRAALDDALGAGGTM
jgi:hypothetical protein